MRLFHTKVEKLFIKLFVNYLDCLEWFHLEKFFKDFFQVYVFDWIIIIVAVVL